MTANNLYRTLVEADYETFLNIIMGGSYAYHYNFNQVDETGWALIHHLCAAEAADAEAIDLLYKKLTFILEPLDAEREAIAAFMQSYEGEDAHNFYHNIQVQTLCKGDREWNTPVHLATRHCTSVYGMEKICKTIIVEAQKENFYFGSANRDEQTVGVLLQQYKNPDIAYPYHPLCLLGRHDLPAKIPSQPSYLSTILSQASNIAVKFGLFKAPEPEADTELKKARSAMRQASEELKTAIENFDPPEVVETLVNQYKNKQEMVQQAWAQEQAQLPLKRGHTY